MGQTCSSAKACCTSEAPPNHYKDRKHRCRDDNSNANNNDCHKTDPALLELMLQSQSQRGQSHLLYSKKNNNAPILIKQQEQPPRMATRLVIRRREFASPISQTMPLSEQQPQEEGISGTHIYAVRYSEAASEQCPTTKDDENISPTTTIVQEEDTQAAANNTEVVMAAANNMQQPIKSVLPAVVTSTNVNQLFSAQAMAMPPARKVLDWITVSEDHDIHVLDVGLSAAECDHLVQITEKACKGQYAAYTYAKQTLGCREYPTLAQACFPYVHAVVSCIQEQFSKNAPLQLDDREPHLVKYDVTKKERQKLDMHTDKSEWTFLIALSNGCGLDYDGGGTYFEFMDATLHVQRGHALVFPGKLRHCGQRISSGLRFLLVGFLVEQENNASRKSPSTKSTKKKNSGTTKI